MPLEKAINYLQLDLDDPGSVPIEILNEAQELGLEALKWRKEEKASGYLDADDLLPSETEEE